MILRKCTKCSLEATSEYDLKLFEKAKKSKYGRLNLCKVCRKDRDASYYVDNSDYINARDKEYRDSDVGISTKSKWLNSDVGKESCKRYQQSEKGKANSIRTAKKYRTTDAGKKASSEATARYNSKEENREKLRLNWAKHSATKRAKRIQRVPKWLTSDDYWLIEQFYITAKERTERYGIEFEVDHIVPLNGKLVSGLHVPDNLQVITGFENNRKSNHFKI